MHATRHSRFAAVALVVLWASAAEAQLSPPSTGGVVVLDQLLQQLTEHRRVLVIGAHPDDEDTGLLTLVSRRYGAQAAYLSLSRGEGGQNLIGDELGVELGLLRSQELAAARVVDGSRQFFTRAYDFGYSRSIEETERFWPPDSVLKDVVRIVRRFRPHVIVSTFSGTSRDGHGQHQMAGVSARLAFEAAGDPTRFPELEDEEGLHPWRPIKLYRSTRFDSAATTVRLFTSELDARTGKTFHQIAMAARSLHRSQDMGRLQSLGPAWTRLQLLATSSGGVPVQVEQGIFDGIAADTSALARMADSLRHFVPPVRLADAAPRLVKALASIDPLPELEHRRLLLEQAIAVSAGLVLDARAAASSLVPGQDADVTVELYNAGPYEVSLENVAVESPEQWPVRLQERAAAALAPGGRVLRRLTVSVPAEAQPTQPYYLERPRVGTLYDWSAAAPNVRGMPFAPPVLVARAVVELLGGRVTLEREVTYRFNDQARGEIRQAVRVMPALDVRLTPGRVLWPSGAPATRTFTVDVAHHGSAPLAGEVVLTTDGWPMPAAQRFSFAEGGESRRFTFRVTRPSDVEEQVVTVHAVARTDDGRSYDRGIRSIEYPHVRAAARVTPASTRVRVARLALPALRSVGYVRGAADRVPEALAQLGLPIEVLASDLLGGEDLGRFDAVVVGSRAYETDAKLIEHNDRLLEYVREGGLVLVQYQQYQFARGGFAPYPMTIAVPHDRITDETSPVRLLDPDHAVFRVPNRIGPGDWDDWPQERGLYFATTWDEAYIPLLEMQDPDRAPVRGGLLVAHHGRGTYVYTGISFFRSLPAGATGPARLFLNLLGLAGTRGP